MMQLTLWNYQENKERQAKTPIFRVIIEKKLYLREGGQLLSDDRIVHDSILFLADGQITDDQESAIYMITRHQGVRVRYMAWLAHHPEPYSIQSLFEIDAGHSYGSRDVLTWKRFIKANDLRWVKTVTHRSCLIKPA